MKPTNQKAHNQSLLKFFLMWAVTTALIVTAIVLTYKTPSEENARLKKRVESLRKDSIQQHLMESTLDGIDATMVSLFDSYNEDTLRKLDLYPLEGIEDTEMKARLENIRSKISGLIKSANQNKDQCKRDLEICRETLSLRDEQIRTKDATIEQLRYQGASSSGQ